MKKKTILLLCALLVCSVFQGCGDEEISFSTDDTVLTTADFFGDMPVTADTTYPTSAETAKREERIYPIERKRYQIDLTGDGIYENIEIRFFKEKPPTVKIDDHNLPGYLDEKTNTYYSAATATYYADEDPSKAEKALTCTPVEHGWKISIGESIAYVMTDAFVMEGDPYDTPRLDPAFYYRTGEGQALCRTGAGGKQHLERYYDILLGDGAVCGALCESLSLVDGAFVPTAWEYVISSKTTVKPVGERDVDHYSTFVPEDALWLECSSDTLGRSDDMILLSYRTESGAPCVYYTSNRGASFQSANDTFKGTALAETAFESLRIVEIAKRNDGTFLICFETKKAGGKSFYCSEWLYQHGGFEEVDHYPVERKGNEWERIPTSCWDYYDVTGDGVADQVTIHNRGKSNVSESVKVIDGATGREHTLPSAFTAEKADFISERTKDGWRLSVGGRQIYVREDGFLSQESFYETPKLGENRRYYFAYDENSENYFGGTPAEGEPPQGMLIFCRMDIYVSDSTVCGMLEETYTFDGAAFVSTAWDFAVETTVPQPYWEKGYIESFRPDGATGLLCVGASIGGQPYVLSFDTDEKDPCVYFTCDRGKTFIELPVALSEVSQYDRARVVEMQAGNSYELALIVELTQGDDVRYAAWESVYDGGSDFKSYGFSRFIETNGD